MAIGEIASSIGAAFGGSDWSPQYAPGAKKQGRALAGLSRKVISDIRPAQEAFTKAWEAENPRQASLRTEQERLLRSLLSRRQGSTPEQLLGSVGDRLFGYINPNVINPLSAFDVSLNRINRRAAGMNPAVVDSTADRLRNARIASGRYFDASRDAFRALPGVFDQVYNAGVSNDDILASYLPAIMRNYRSGVDDVTLAPIRALMKSVGDTSSMVGNVNQGIQSGVVGYTPDKNWADYLAAFAPVAGSVLGGAGKTLDGAVSGIGRALF